MNCCTNPIDLGCRPSCAPITTNISGIEGDIFNVYWTFNGTYQTAQAEVIDGFVTIPGNIFNESQPVNFSIYDSENVFVACFKATIRPGDIIVQEIPVTIPFTTSINIQSDGCSNDQWSGIMEINLNTIDALQNGSILDLHHDILHNGNSTPHSITVITPGIDYVGDDLIITDVSLIENPIKLQVHVTSKNCNHSFTIDAVIDHVENLATGYSNTTNTPLTTFTWP